MDSIQIGKVIQTHRKIKGITQEELASHLGVSKPAVSKWESGQSYPDIVLLPELAAYFNITVDQLIGYEPQMTKEDIRKLYRRLSEDFVKEPFDKVYQECEEYIKKYFSCWLLQFNMGLVLVNNAGQAGSQERGMQIIERALEIFDRVAKSSDDVTLAEQALKLQAVCYLGLQRPVEAIDILENMNKLPMPVEPVLVRAYQMKGDRDKAKQIIQGYTYMNLLNLLGAASDFFQLYANEPERFNQYYNLFMEVSKTFQVEELHPVFLLQMNIGAAMVYAAQGNKEAAISVLEYYTKLLINTGDKFYLHGNQIFDELEGYLSTMELDDSLPRSSTAIWRDLIKLVIDNPAFTGLEDEEGFKQIKRKLENI